LALTGDVFKRVEKEKAIYIHLQFTDILGCLKEISFSIQRLSDVLKSGAWFDGSSIGGVARIHENGLYLKPDTVPSAV
jgi:glutamine synthetase